MLTDPKFNSIRIGTKLSFKRVCVCYKTNR